MQRDPRMGMVVETRNNIAEIDVDILIEEAPDTVTMQQEQFDSLANLLSASAPPPMLKALVELSLLRNKKRSLDALEGDEQ
jgi:hypothetical protein